MENQELELIKGAQAGRGGDFAKLYDIYVERIYRFIYYKTYHKETAEDLTSQTFFKAFEKINTFRSEKGKLSSWLYRIAQNTVIDYMRAKHETKNIEDVFDLSSDSDLSLDAENKMLLSDIKEAIKSLKPLQREVVRLRVWEDLSYAEIAEIIGKTESHCKVEYSRALKVLKNSIPLGVYLILLLSN